MQGGGGDGGKSKSVSSTLFQRLGSLKKSKKLTLSGTSPPATPSIVDGKTFVVQYLGSLPVSNVDGLDTVRPVVQVSKGCGQHVVVLMLLCVGVARSWPPPLSLGQLLW